jgi:hypothetical protein
MFLVVGIAPGWYVRDPFISREVTLPTYGWTIWFIDLLISFPNDRRSSCSILTEST